MHDAMDVVLERSLRCDSWFDELKPGLVIMDFEHMLPKTDCVG
jgi:hypothetical protein